MFYFNNLRNIVHFKIANSLGTFNSLDLLFQPLVKTMHFSARLLVKLSFYEV